MKSSTWLVVGGGVVLAGVGIYFLTKKSTPSTTDAAKALPSSPGGSMIVYTDPTTGAQYTRDHAAQTACKLRAIGHPREAVFWAGLVTSNGGVLPC